MNAPNDPTKKKTESPAKENSVFVDQQRIKCSKSSKWRTTLKHLLRGPRHRFHGERWGDHALHSTVATLNRAFGLSIARDWTEVPNRFGTHTRVKRYWVDDKSRSQAFQLLGKCRDKGGEE